MAQTQTTLLHLDGRVTDLAGGLQVRRLLPAAARRAVGPFIFFDHMGPAEIPAETDSDVGGHPHIGLATVTYLYEGSLMHRDSLGSVQEITPGAVNWMTAGSGIVHSERTPEALRGRSRRLHGLQLWLALPPELETTAPAFQHVAAEEIPQLAPADGVTVRVLAGTALGATSPVRTASPTVYLDVRLAPGAAWTLPPLAEELAIYAPTADYWLDDVALPARQMAVLPAGSGARLRAGATETRLAVIGGAPLARPVRMWWNFVATDRARIAAAAKAWAAGGFDPIPDETDRIAAPPWVD
ncbi:pirin family protein [Denitratisoma sp. agr-D3]